MNKNEIKDYIDSVNGAANRAAERSYINKVYSYSLYKATKIYNESINKGDYTDIDAFNNYKDDFIAAYSAYNFAIDSSDNRVINNTEFQD